MGTLQNKIDQLKSLEDEYRKEREKVMLAIQDVIRSIGQNPAIKPISKNIFTIKSSEIMGTSWSPTFHDWNVQAELLIDVLLKRPVDTWCDFIRKIANKRGSVHLFTGITVDKTQLNQKFVKEVYEKL